MRIRFKSYATLRICRPRVLARFISLLIATADDAARRMTFLSTKRENVRLRIVTGYPSLASRKRKITLVGEIKRRLPEGGRLMSSSKLIGYSLRRNRITARHSIKTRRMGSDKPLKVTRYRHPTTLFRRKGSSRRCTSSGRHGCCAIRIAFVTPIFVLAVIAESRLKETLKNACLLMTSKYNRNCVIF